MTIENEAVTAPRAGRREWIGLAVLALACVLYAMDLTVLHLAVPRLSADLQPSSAQLLWIVDIYGFMVAGSLIMMGTLGDRIGRRRLLLIGASAFGVASVLAAFSPSAETLIAARALLGLAGATLAPSTLSLIRNMFLDPHQRTVAVGVWITSFSVGGAIGPLLGGVMLEFFWWGSVFLLAVPVMAVLLVLGPVLLPEFRDPDAGRPDPASVALSLVAVLSVIFGLKQIAQDGLGMLPALSIACGIGIGVTFIRRQKKLVDPLIDVRLFRRPAFSASLVTFTLAIFAMFGTFLYVAQYLQLVRGLSPLMAGVWMLPQSVGFIAGSMVAPVIVRRFRPASVMGVGLSVTALGLGIITQVDGTSGQALLVTGSVVMSLGLGPVFTLGTDLIISAAPPERAGAASGISETSAELGGALGIAVLGSIGTAVYRNRLAESLPAGLPPEAAEAARDTLGGALAVARQVPQPVGGALTDVAHAAFTDGLRLTATIGCLAMIAVAVFAASMLRRLQAAGPDTEKQSDVGPRTGEELLNPAAAEA